MIWAVVLFALGIISYQYFQPGWINIAFCLPACFAIYSLHKTRIQPFSRINLLASVAPFIVLLGCLACKIRTSYLQNNVDLPPRAIDVTGRVVQLKNNKIVLADMSPKIVDRALVKIIHHKDLSKASCTSSGSHVSTSGKDTTKQINLTERSSMARDTSNTSISKGDIISAKVYLHEPEPNFTPLSQDPRFYAFFDRMSAHGKAWQVEVIQYGPPSWLQSTLEEQADLPQAILLNDKSLLSAQTVENFTKSGFSHILAISGLHLAILYKMVQYLVKAVLGLALRGRCFYPLPISPKTIVHSISLLALGFYAYITGFGYSVLRSLIMVCVGLPIRLIDSLSITALIIMAIFPESIYYASFQLSFMAVLGFCWTRSYKNFIVQSIYITFGISALTFPVVAYHFQEIALQPFLTNLILMPYVSFIFLPSLFLFWWVPVLSKYIIGYQCIFFKWVLAKLSVLSVTYTGLIIPGSALACYCLTIVFFNSKHKYITYCGWVAAILLTYCYQPPIAFMDRFGKVHAVPLETRLSIGTASPSSLNVTKPAVQYKKLYPGSALYQDGSVKEFAKRKWWEQS